MNANAKIDAVRLGGNLWMGTVDGKQVCGPYLNKGMAVRQAKNKAAKMAPADPFEAVREAARAEARKLGLTEAQIETFLAAQSA